MVGVKKENKEKIRQGLGVSTCDKTKRQWYSDHNEQELKVHFIMSSCQSEQSELYCKNSKQVPQNTKPSNKQITIHHKEVRLYDVILIEKDTTTCKQKKKVKK